MKALSLLTLVFAIALIAASCGKNIPAPSNINLAKKPLNEVKAVLRGTWQLHYMRGGFCGVCEYERYNEFYTFGANDHITWTIDKATMADTTINWIKQEWQANEINVMEFYANDANIHHLSPERITKDTLVMYEPGPDGMSYYFTKVK